MLRSNVRRTLLTTCLLVIVAGCGRNPEFRDNLAQQAYHSVTELYVLLAKANLGALRHPSSYGGEVDRYAVVIGGFQAGRLLASDRLRGSKDPHSLDGLDTNIERCVDAVRQMAEMHQRTGIDQGSGMIRTVRASCDTAATSIAGNEASSWFVSTLAGDL